MTELEFEISKPLLVLLGDLRKELKARGLEDLAEKAFEAQERVRQMQSLHLMALPAP